MHENMELKAKLIKEIVDEHYVPNSHKGSLRDIFCNYVVKIYPMHENTFYKLVNHAIKQDGFIGKRGNRVTVTFQSNGRKAFNR